MKKKILYNFLFWITLISPIISFYLVGIIGEIDVFGVFGLVRYSWIMLLFIPIPILTFLVGFNQKKQKGKYKKFYIICFICLPLLIIFGSYRFIFNVSYDSNIITKLENKIKIQLPENIKIAAYQYDQYSLGYGKIIDEETKKEFEENIFEDELWMTNLSPSIKGVLPINLQYELSQYDYFLIYDITNNKYNSFISEGNCIFFVAYSCKRQSFMFLYDYVVNF